MLGRTMIVIAALLAGSNASAQDSSHWGVVVSVDPSWSVPSAVGNAVGGTIDLRGSDFAIGIARGRELGGDWGVSYVRKTLSDDSRIGDVSSQCGFANGCFLSGESLQFKGTTLSGLELHKYVNFVTIKGRAQIGMNFAGGFAKVSGSQERHVFDADIIGSDRTGPIARQRETVTTEPADLGLSTFPLLKIQLAVSAIVAPGLKIRAAGGLNAPGTETFSVTAVYLFGKR